MAPKNKKVENVDPTTTETIKAKRGRKSKKELMEALNMKSLVKENESNPQSQLMVNLNVVEIGSDTSDVLETQNEQSNLYEDMLNNENSNHVEEPTKHHSNVIITTTVTSTEEPKVAKKRGRKPKGGKIIQQVVNNEPQKEDRPNVILHLKKCSLKDLQTSIQSNDLMEPYNFLVGKGDLNYELIADENNSNNDKGSKSITTLDTCYECDDYDDESVGKDSTKEIWKKLKQLEHNLHINNVNNILV